MPVTELKERDFHSASLDNCTTKISKRAFIEMQLEENKEPYDQDESELQAKKKRHMDWRLNATGRHAVMVIATYHIQRHQRRVSHSCSATILTGELKEPVDPIDSKGLFQNSCSPFCP